jgi:phytoene dehydrogenase-like protein
MQKKINIIGAGIAGLSAGCYLQMNGYDTEIFELHSLPGGLCTSWNRGGYTFDGCIHWLVGSNPNHGFYDLWNELIDMKNTEFIEQDYHSVFSDLNGNTVTFYTRVDELEKEFLSKAPEDKNTIYGFIKAIRKFTRFSPPLDKSPETSNLWDGLKIISKMIPYMGTYKKWMRISVNDFADLFKNELIRNSLKNNSENDMPALFLVMMYAWMNKRSSGYPIGGSLKFAQKIEKKYLELGGEINYGNKIKKIIVKNGNACGIISESGEESKANIVISAADGHYTLFNMLDGKYTGKKIENVYKTYKTFPSYLQVSLGVNHNFSNVPHQLNFPLDKKIKIDEETEINSLSVRIFNFDKTMAPKGKTSMYSLITTRNNSYWEYLRKNDKVRYQSEKSRIANQVIDAIDKKIGNVKANIEEVDVSTPATVIRYTNNWKGSYEGWLPDKNSGITGLKKTLPGLENFYMIGQWIEIGGGLPPAILSGRNVAQIICKKDKKKFTTIHY